MIEDFKVFFVISLLEVQHRVRTSAFLFSHSCNLCYFWLISSALQANVFPKKGYFGDNYAIISTFLVRENFFSKATANFFWASKTDSNNTSIFLTLFFPCQFYRGIGFQWHSHCNSNFGYLLYLFCKLEVVNPWNISSLVNLVQIFWIRNDRFWLEIQI